MLLDKTLCIALLISLIFHLTIFLPLPCFMYPPIKRPLPPLKITYLVPKVTLAQTPRVKESPVLKTETKQIKKETVATEDKTDKSLNIKKEPLKELVKLPQPKAKQEKIVIPPELPKEKESLYLNYYQAIRNKIRSLVVQNYPRFIACGEVCLYFVLLSNGELKEIKIIEERSSQNQLLKEIAKRSVQQASPFSSFPKDLNQTQLSFNVIIAFETEN